MKIRTLLLTSLGAMVMACSTKVPESFTENEALPAIYPDYANVTIPVNIAPLTFELDDPDADEMVARYAAGNVEIVCADKMQPDIDDWHELIHSALSVQPSAIQADVYARHGDQWTHYQPFSIYVSTDSIDPWLSYRLIPPSFVSYESLTINQRCLENYDERVIYDNMLCGLEKDGQCINCHHYQQYNPQRMQFHARQSHGGTLIAYDGKLTKVNMKNDSILSAGVYPAWHPWLNLIVYSTDRTHQSFHTTDPNKIEVFDTESDIIAYDVERAEVTNVENDPNEMEVFPAWTPDGRTLYYCSAHFELSDSAANRSTEVVNRSQELKYKLYRKSFNPDTWEFGPSELVFDPSSEGSAVLPRISPDGRFLVFTMASYGYFHIWHHDADLWMMDLQEQRAGSMEQDEEQGTGSKEQENTPAADISLTPTPSPLTPANSPDTESYHAWSSNSRWLVFSSRRDDGVFTRPFFAHIDEDGNVGKPFELPAADPDYHRQFMRCYNIPEFMRGPVTIAPQTFADVFKESDGITVKYVQQLHR